MSEGTPIWVSDLQPAIHPCLLPVELAHFALTLNPIKKEWAILVAGKTGAGGGAYKEAVDCAITAKICTMVVCDVIYKIVLDFYIIYANLCEKSDFLL